MDAERFCEVIKFVVGLVFGGCAGGLIGFKIGNSKQIKQSQKAGDNSNMIQVGESRHG